MADKPDLGAEAQEAAGIAAAETATVIEAVKDNAEAAIAIAAAEAEAAQELAQKLTEAALATELGRMVQACEGKVSECQLQMAELSTLVTAQTELITAQALELAVLKSASLSPLIQQPPAIQPPTLEVIPETGGALDPTQASHENLIPGNQPEPPHPQAARKKRFV